MTSDFRTSFVSGVLIIFCGFVAVSCGSSSSDTTGPSLVSLSPGGGSFWESSLTFTLEFSEAMAEDSATETNLESLFADSTCDNPQVSDISFNETTLSFQVDATCDEAETLVFSLADNSLTDSAGNAFSSSASSTYYQCASWCQTAYLKNLNAGESERFGAGVISPGDTEGLSLSGDTLAIAIPAEDSGGTGISSSFPSSLDQSSTGSGAVAVYRKTNGLWALEAFIKAPNNGAGDFFGAQVAISGDLLAVSASAEDSNQTGVLNDGTAPADNSSSDSGAVYVFSRSSEQWAFESFLKAPNLGADEFGKSLDIDNDTIVVGANFEDSDQRAITNGATADALNDRQDSGAAYVFRRTGSDWAQEAFIKASNADAFDYFGFSVRIEGDVLVVGSYGEDSNQTTVTNGATASADNTGTDSGAAYVFRRSGTTWTQEAFLKPSNSDNDDTFGFSVDVSGDRIAVGAFWEESNQTFISTGTTASANNDADRSGAVYLFDRIGGNWQQVAYLKASNAETDDFFGYTLSLDGSRIASASTREDAAGQATQNTPTSSSDNSLSAAGAVFIFEDESE